MLWHIIKRELYDHLISLRFALTVGLTTLLMAMNALFFVGSDYRQRLEDYSKNVASVADTVRKNAEHLNDLADKGPVALYKRPSPLSFCANDQDDTLPIRIHAGLRGSGGRGDGQYFYSFNSPWILQYVQDTYQKNSMLQTFTALDWAFIIGVVISFVAFLFTFDAISGERERGTLALALSNPVRRGTLLLGKFAAAFLAIAVPVLIGLLLSTLIVAVSGVASFGGEEWACIGAMGGLSLIYVALFIGVGLAVSSRMQGSSTSLLLLLTIWVIVVVLAPNTLGSLVSTLHRTPSQYEFQQRKNDALETLHRDVYKSDQNMFQHGSPSEANPKREAVELWAKYLKGDWEIETRFTDEQLDAEFAQVRFARHILRVSPTAMYNYAMEALAGTGFTRHQRFVDAARRYRGRFVDFIKEADKANPDSFHIYGVKEGLSSKPVSFEAVPHFVEPSGVDVAMRAALVDFSLLVVMAVVGFMGSYVAFLKSPVR